MPLGVAPIMPNCTQAQALHDSLSTREEGCLLRWFVRGQVDSGGFHD
jgi:hypothetical protein